MLVLRSALFNVLFYLNLVVQMIVGLPTILFGHRAILRLATIWARSSLWLLRVICGTRVEFRGLDRVTPGSLIVAAKHQSFLDVIALLTIFAQSTFVLKRQLTRIPLFGLYLSCSGQIAIDRARGRSALAQAGRGAAEALAEGRQFLIFPEGTRRPPGAEPQYKYGVAVIYDETRVPCLPVALNSGLFWPRRSFLRRPGTVVVELLEPIGPGLDKAAFLSLLRDRIETASDRLLDEATRRDPQLKLACAGPSPRPG